MGGFRYEAIDIGVFISVKFGNKFAFFTKIQMSEKDKRPHFLSSRSLYLDVRMITKP